MVMVRVYLLQPSPIKYIITQLLTVIEVLMQIQVHTLKLISGIIYCLISHQEIMSLELTVTFRVQIICLHLKQCGIIRKTIVPVWISLSLLTLKTIHLLVNRVF